MFPLKFSLALILGFVKFDKCADLVVPAQPTYVPRLKVLFTALPPLFRFHRDLKFSKSFCFSSTRQMVPHPSCQPFFSYSSVWYRSVTFFHLSKFRTCMSLLCFSCRLISCFSLRWTNDIFEDQSWQSIKVWTFRLRLSSFFFSVPALMSFRHGLVEGQQSYNCLLWAFSFFSNFDMPLDLLTISDTFGSALRLEC